MIYSNCKSQADFYPRSPCGERHQRKGSNGMGARFLSTLSLRRATPCPSWARRTGRNFYPRSPCGERPVQNGLWQYSSKFLSTLSLRRATCTSSSWAFKLANFYPRSPCGERHHAETGRKSSYHFYPRSPCGERRQWPCIPRSATGISIHALLAESDTTREVHT